MMSPGFQRFFAAAALGHLLVVSACAPPPPPTAASRSAQAALNACRQRADEVYQRQNRGAIFLQDNRDAPESAGYLSGITTRGLADRYGWDSQVSECVSQSSGGGAAGGFSPGPTPVTGAAPSGSSTPPR